MRVLPLALGPTVGVLLWFHFRGGFDGGPFGAGKEAPAIVIGLLGWMAIWWATQVVDMAVTGLLPIVVLPITGAARLDAVLAPYANDVIFLFAGGCVLGLAIEQHGLGSRLLFGVMKLIGDSPGRVVAAFLVVTACVSAFVSNTATAAMMLPLAMAAVGMYSINESGQREPSGISKSFQRAVLLAVAYGASIGGVMSVLGSPPNVIGVEWLAANGRRVDFVRWASVGVPVGVAMLIAAQCAFWWGFPLSKFRSIKETIHGSSCPVPMSTGARRTLVVFLLAVIAWVGSPAIVGALPGLQLKDGMIAIAAAIALFVIPSAPGQRAPLVAWSQTQRLPWGAFILFGGGLSLAEAMQSSGVSAMITQSCVGLGGLPEPIMIAMVAAILIFTSEVGSNTALAAAAVPIVGAMAPGLGLPPEKLVIAAVMGASLAFMLPVGTPPNAMVFSTGLLPMREMMRIGFFLNLCAIAAITAACTWLI